ACCAGPGRLDIRIRAPLSAADDVDRTADLIRRIAGLQLVEESLRPMEEMLVERLRAAGKTIALAESCTGGLIGARLTTVPGCSEVFPGGLLAYSNTVKIEMLGVRPETLAAAGAVSAETAREMAVGARRQFRADIGLAVTGIAGPGGGTPEKPVGQVWIALSTEAGETAEFFRFAGTRDFIREGATQMALDLLRRALSESKPQKRRPGGEESFDSPPGFGYQ
ncbi:MAG: nicotinamide-nucleotide amidohydrolase family protein, partial [Kiritimatiellia bacterium]|nr:nicotinamide-nucleotide amidohydrolase family protein [Kiritimatiellia bacterium]